MATAEIRGVPGHVTRTRPRRLSFSPSANGNPHTLEVDQMWAGPQPSDIILNSASEADSSTLHTAPDTISISEEVFPLAADELGSDKPEERVTPESPIVTPKSDNETLVPGTLASSGRGGGGDSNTLNENMVVCERRSSPI